MQGSGKLGAFRSRSAASRYTLGHLLSVSFKWSSLASDVEAAWFPQMTNRYFYGLDGARFFAALSVCVFHLGFYVWAANNTTLANAFAHSASFTTLTPVVWPGWVG